MATTITGIDQSKVINTLDTFTHTCLNTAPYLVSITVSESPPSGLTLAIQHNGSNVVTAAAPTSNQAVTSLSTTIACTASDTISVVVASPNNSDTLPNQFKGTLIFSSKVV